MKFVPVSISRKVATQVFVGKRNAPTLLFGAGIVGIVGSTVLACRASLKLEGLVTEVQETLDKVNSLEHDKYTESDRNKDRITVYTRAAFDMTKLYGPSIV